MIASLSTSALAQHIQQQFKAKNPNASQSVSASPASPSNASPPPAEITTMAKPIQVEIVPSKTTAKGNWISLLTLGACFALLTTNLWWPAIRNKFNPFFKQVKKIGVTFNDVIGADEAKKDLMDILDFIKNPEKYNKQGAKMPSGVLLQGPPGTGKTLLAKAVAGEAGVPFLSASGSDFIEKYVGVGAQRVRELFRQARQLSENNTPVIIFIDEIDTLIQNRAKQSLEGGDSEYSATVNALLTEMDGMVQSKHPIIVMGATNAPLEKLDPAMLRPGRLSRHVRVALPDLKGRQGLFDYYGKKYKLSPEALAHLNTLAKNSFGSSGADIENILNEAAMLTARNNLPSITPAMLEEAVERVIQGHTKDLKLTDKVKKQIAVHEIGHAIVGHFLESKNEVRKITIVPRGNSLGATLSQPKEGNDDYFTTRETLINRMAILLGGRVAEEIVFGPQKVGTGASGDLEAIRQIAEAMVLEFGWNGLAPRNFSNSRMPISEQTKRSLANAVDQIVEEGRLRAVDVLNHKKPLLNKATAALLKHETLDKEAFEVLVKQHRKPHKMGMRYRLYSWINKHRKRK